jgi:7-dehydrocholesterol reductase
MVTTRLELADATVRSLSRSGPRGVPAASHLEVTKAQRLLWGRRRNVSGIASLPSMVLIIAAPLVVLCLYTALTQHDGSIEMTLRVLQSHGIRPFLRECFSGLTVRCGMVYIGWVAFQAILYHVIPGKIAVGPPTPGGHSLPYRINGLWSWIATLAVFLVFVGTGKVEPSFIATHGGELLVAANIYGLLITTVCTVKCYMSTRNTRDVRFSGK